ncbi:unnamed protein product [Alopecurus aequalis]
METIYKKEVTATPEDNTEGRDGSTLKGRHDPRNPSYPLRPHVAGTPVDADAADHNIPVKERMKKTGAILANSRATDIIIPDCTPKKIFLDTIRMLAKHTDNLLDELCMYITEGKIVQTAVLLLAAQEQIRRVSSRKRDGSSKQDGFFTVINHVLDDIAAIKLQMCQKELEMEPLEKKKSLLNTILMLVRVISKAGEALDYYIRSHEKVPDVTQVPHMEVLARVSLILKDHGFCYTGDGIDIGNLCPYENVMSSEELPDKFGEMAMIKAGTEVTRLPNGKAKGKKEPRGWALKLARRSFFPYWRSVLTSRFPVKLCPLKELQATLAKASAIRGRNPEVKASYQSRRLFGTVLASQFPAKLCPLKELEATLTKTTGEASIVMGRDPQVKASCQTRRLFGTVASTLLKVLRKA